MDRISMAATAAVMVAIGAMAAPADAETYTNEDGRRVECHDERVTKEGHPVAAPLAGAVVGGLVGNQFGSGSGKKAATVAGAIGGGVAGKKIDESRTENGTTVRRVCREVG